MNDLEGLQECLFRAIDRLEGDLTHTQLEQEIRRSEAIVSVAKVAVENANTAIKAAYLADGFIKKESRLPKMLES